MIRSAGWSQRRSGELERNRAPDPSDPARPFRSDVSTQLAGSTSSLRTFEERPHARPLSRPVAAPRRLTERPHGCCAVAARLRRVQPRRRPPKRPRRRSPIEASAQPVPDQYIVTLRDAVADSPAAAADELTDAHGGTVLQVYDNALQGFAATMTKPEVEALASDPAVAVDPAGLDRRARRHRDAHPVVGPRPRRPAHPAARQPLHVRVDGPRRPRVRHRHRDPGDPRRLRWPRVDRRRQGRRRPERQRLQRARHPRRRHHRWRDGSASPRTCPSSRCGCSPVPVPDTRPTSSRGSTGSPPTPCSPPSPT